MINAIRLEKTAEISREEWLAARCRGIGGSDAAAIVGLNPYASPFSVYCDKMGLLPEREDTEPMRQGRDFEDYVARRFTERTGKKVRRENHMLAHPKHDFIIANVDRLIVGEAAGLECKTTSVYNKTDFAGGDVPLQYYVQCLHYMLVTGLRKWYLAVLVLNKDFFTLETEWIEADGAALLKAEVSFWENHILKGNPPPPDGTERATEVLNKLYPASRGVDFPAINLYGREAQIKRMLKLKEQIKELDAEKTEMENLLKADLKDNERGIAEGYAVEWKNTSRSDIDAKRLKAERPEVYQSYLRKTDYRKFAVKEL